MFVLCVPEKRCKRAERRLKEIIFNMFVVAWFFFIFYFFPAAQHAGEEITAENRSFLPKCPHLLC